MRVITIDGKLVNLDKIHFVRLKSSTSLLISFGTDFLEFNGSPEHITTIFRKLEESNEQFSSTNKW